MRGWIVRLKAAFMRILMAAGTPEEIGRGVAAGFAVAPWPLPGLQIPLSIVLATLVRGNRAVSVIPQAISNPATMLPLALLQYRLGTWLFPWCEETSDARVRLGALKEAFEGFAWNDFGASAQRFYQVLAGLSADVALPLLAGTFLCSVVGAVAGYFGTVWTVRAYKAGQAARLASPGAGGIAGAAADAAETSRDGDGAAGTAGAERSAAIPVGSSPGLAGVTLNAGSGAEPAGSAVGSDVGSEDGRPNRPGSPKPPEPLEFRKPPGPKGSGASNAASPMAAADVECGGDWRKDAAKLGLHPDRFLPGNRVKLLRDGRETYPAMLDAISKASVSVHLETYTLADDFIGRRFAEAMAAAARRGLDVRLLCDAIGSAGLSERFLGELAAAGVRTAMFHPIAPWRKGWALNKRDHRKMLVVDGATGFVGGLNISKEYVPEEEGGDGWRDTHLEICGPAVGAIAEMFRWAWRHAAGEEVHLPDPPRPVPDGVPAKVIGNRLFRDRHLIRAEYAKVIRGAERFVLISNAFFVPDRRIRRSLAQAARRGVRVEVMVPDRSDVPAATYAGRALYARLLKNGIRLFLWPKKMLHAKTAVVDGIWSTVGSYNMNHRSLFHDLEATATILDRAFGAEMVEMFEEDKRRCRELTLREWEARPWRERVIEKLCYLIRYWL